MAVHNVDLQTNIPLTNQATRTDQFGYRIVAFLWFLYLFEPARLLAYYIPILEPLKWLPTFLLLVAIFHWVKTPLKKYGYKWFTIFLILNLFGTIIAFIDGNWGISRTINRIMFQYFMMGIMTFTFFNDDEKVKRLLLLYFLYFLYFSIWGILSLKVSPIDLYADPGARSIVPWHQWLDNRDGFGPLMVIGIAYSFYYHQATQNRKVKWLSLLSIILCLAGVILSFGRGVFLALGVTVIFIWLQAKRKFQGVFLVIVTVGLVIVTASIISPGKLYWEQMESIKEGTSEGSGAERKVLWGFAWEEFMSSPIFGVGPGNFGIAVMKLISPDEAQRIGYSSHGKLWGKALHCAPLTILCEYGLVGSIVFFFLIIDFIKTNLMSRGISQAPLTDERKMHNYEAAQSPAKANYFLSRGLLACFVSFWVSGFFYEIFYAPNFWNLIVLNRLIYITQLKVKDETSSLLPSK